MSRHQVISECIQRRHAARERIECDRVELERTRSALTTVQSPSGRAALERRIHAFEADMERFTQLEQRTAQRQRSEEMAEFNGEAREMIRISERLGVLMAEVADLMLKGSETATRINEMVFRYTEHTPGAQKRASDCLRTLAATWPKVDQLEVVRQGQALGPFVKSRMAVLQEMIAGASEPRRSAECCNNRFREAETCEEEADG